jgi:hypothetical protein
MHQIYALWIGYIRPGASAEALELDWKLDMSDASDMSALGWIYPA